MAEQQGGKTGAGAEAAQGLHGANKSSGNKDDDRSGSEPLEERETEHKSGYGGEKAGPKTSSDQR